MRTIQLSELGHEIHRLYLRWVNETGRRVVQKLLRASSGMVPIRTGRLYGSGQAYWKGRLVDSLGPGPNLRTFRIYRHGGDVIYSQVKPTEGRVAFYHGGRKWFDYSHYNEVVRGRLWLKSAVGRFQSLLTQAAHEAMQVI